MVFDDEKEELSKIYIGLLLKNFLVEATVDPHELGDRIRRFLPDIVIVNNDVPGFDGHEICVLVKEQMSKPILLMAAKESALTTRIDDCSADEILLKPIDIKILEATIERLLTSAQ